MASSSLRDGLALVGRRDIRRLCLAYFVTFAGTAMAPIAMAFGVLELTGSTEDAGFVVAAPTLAAIGVMLLGGAWADRTSRQRMIVAAESLALVTQASIALLFLSGEATVPRLTALMLVSGVAVAFNAPAASGLIVQLVERHELQAANALLGASRHGAISLGAAIGGVLVATLGAGLTLLIDAASFGLSALLVASLRPRAQKVSRAASVLEDLRLGWHAFIEHTWLWAIVAQFSVLVAVHESIIVLLGPAVMRDHFAGASDWGWVVAMFGVGTLTGGFLALRIRPRRVMFFATFLTFVFAFKALALAQPIPLPAILVVAFFDGLAGQLFGILWNTTVQQRIPEEMLSRVGAYDHVGSIALAPLGILAAGFLYEAIGGRATLILGFAISWLASAAALCVRDVRTMTLDAHSPLGTD